MNAADVAAGAATVVGYMEYGRRVVAEAQAQQEAMREAESGLGAVSYAHPSMQPVERMDLWPGRIPYGDLTLLYGDGKIGKGRMITDLIARVTAGWPMPLCSDDTADKPGSVITILPEDDACEAVAWRLRAQGADLSRVYDLTRLEGGTRFKLSATERAEGHIAHLRALIDQLERAGRNPALVVIDPLAAVVGWGTVSTNAGARRVIEPLQDLARETGVAVLVVAHSVKSGQLQGSAGLQQAVRLVYRVSRDKENAGCRVLSQEVANNMGPADDLKFSLTEDTDGMVRVEWVDREKQAAQRLAWRERLAARRGAA